MRWSVLAVVVWLAIAGAPADRTLSGRTLDADGRPLAGVTVTLCESDTCDEPGDSVETDKEGGYRFEHVKPGTVWVQASATGRATRSKRARDSVVDDLWLPGGGSISGNVVNADGTPVESVSMSAGPVDNVGGAFLGRYPIVRAKTDDNGAFRLEGITAGTRYRVFAKADDESRGASDAFAIGAGDAIEDVTIRLRAPATLQFRLVDAEDRPAERIELRLDSEVENTRDGMSRSQDVERDDERLEAGEDGRWTVRSLQPGVFRLRIEPDGYRSLCEPGVVLRDGETTDLGTLTLERGAMLHGKVVDKNGTPVGGAEVRARWRNMQGEYARSTVSDGDGTFAIAGVPEHLLYVQARAEGFATRIVEEVSSGDEPVVVTLTEPGTIRGRVRLAEGGAPSSFDVHLVPRRRAAAAFDVAGESAVEQTADSFEVRGLTPGTHAVEIRAPDRLTVRLKTIRVRAGETADVGEVRLEEGLVVRGRVVHGDGNAPVAGARVRADRGAGPASWSRTPADARAVSSRDGRFEVGGLESTRYTFTLDHPDFAPLQRSVVLDGNRALDTVELRLTEGGSVEGTVLNGDGLPVAGAGIVVARARNYDIRTTTTGPDGSFHVDRLAPGSYMVIRSGTAAGSDFGNVRTVEIREGEAASVKFGPAP